MKRMKYIICTTRVSEENNFESYNNGSCEIEISKNENENKKIKINYLISNSNKSESRKLVIIDGYAFFETLLDFSSLKPEEIANEDDKKKRCELINNFKEATEQLLNCLSCKEADKESVIFAIHWGGVQYEKQMSDIYEWLSYCNIDFPCLLTYWSSTTDEEIKATTNINNVDFDNFFDKLKARAKKKLIVLLHRIAILFLPLDIDLQGIQEVRSGKLEVGGKTPEKRATDYLQEVLESKNGNTQYYRQKLADLWFIVAGSRFQVPNDPCKEAKPVKHSEKKEFVKNNNSILGLTEKSEKEKNKKNEKEIEELKQTLLTLAGLKTKNQKQGTENQEQGTKNHEPITDSPIFRFMCLMDCKIQKLKNEKTVDANDVKRILEFDWKILDSQLKTLNSKPEITDFHSWFRLLMSCLQDLRKQCNAE